MYRDILVFALCDQMKLVHLDLLAINRRQLPQYHWPFCSVHPTTPRRCRSRRMACSALMTPRCHIEPTKVHSRGDYVGRLRCHLDVVSTARNFISKVHHHRWGQSPHVGKTTIEIGNFRKSFLYSFDVVNY